MDAKSIAAGTRLPGGGIDKLNDELRFRYPADALAHATWMKKALGLSLLRPYGDV